MNAINAYFALRLQDVVYTPASFAQEIAAFDEQQRTRFGATMSAADFDAVFADQRNVVTYVLAKHGIHTRYVEIGAAAHHLADAIASGAFLVYNADHIWTVGRRDQRWFQFDSNVVAIDPICLAKNRSVGLLIPIADPMTEFIKIASELDESMARSTIGFSGDAETLLGSAIALLDAHLGRRRAEFPVIAKLIDDYYVFTRIERPNADIIGRHVPSLVRRVGALRSLSIRLQPP